MFLTRRKVSNDIENNSKGKSAPKTTRLLLAELVQSYLVYSSELTYFAINTFQITSLRRVQTSTFKRLQGFCVPRVCAFHYSLDREYDEFVQQMKKLCQRTRTTFLDIRSARIHFPRSSMSNLPETARSLNVFQCNIERLRDLKQIHQDLGQDLLLPSDQLLVSLDLLATNFQLILCELDNQIRFNDALILQSIAKDIFLQFRVILTWIYPAVEKAAFRNNDKNKELNVQRCEDPKKATSQFCRKHSNEKQRKRKFSRSADFNDSSSLAINKFSSDMMKNNSSMNCDHRKIKQTERSESQITIDPLSRDSLRIESKQNDVMRHGNEKKFESLTCSFVSTSDNKSNEGRIDTNSVSRSFSFY